MDKKLILSVAGSGKTRYILDRLNLDENILIITYTVNNEENIRKRIIDKFTYFPPNITLSTYFHFLYSFCYKPFLSYKLRDTGIEWNMLPIRRKGVTKTKIPYYMNTYKRLYHNRLALLVKDNCPEDVKSRVEKYFDKLFIDEVQDFGGHDFNFLELLISCNIPCALVGDYYQHTFDTSRDGNTNKTLHDDLEKYKLKLTKFNLKIDEKTLKKSWRCSKSVCDFISEKIGILIESKHDKIKDVRLLEDLDEITKVLNDDSIIKLVYDLDYTYYCNTRNWGASKGEDKYNDICVVLPKNSYNALLSNKLNELKPKTKNKLYVACTRAKGNLYFVHADHLLVFKKHIF